MKKLSIIMAFLYLLIIPNVYAKNLDIYSKNALLYNVEEDKIMYQKNKDEKAYIASLTKVLTALVVIEKEPNLDKKIDFKKVDYKFLKDKDLKISSLDSNKEYTYKDLLYSFILESSADCGYALALDTSKNIEEFSKLMNKKAQELNMKDSKFSNPVGLDEKDNYSTMSDMLKLMKASLKNKTLKKIMSTKEYTTTNDKKVHHTFVDWEETYDLNMPYLKGGKTGYNDIPGYALLSYANKNNSTYILVTTNASYEYDNPKHFKDAKKLYEYYFNNYEYQSVIKKDENLVSLNTKFLKEDKVTIKANKDIVAYLEKDYNKEAIKIEYKGIEIITPTTKKNSKLGTASIYYKDDLLKTIDITLNQKTHISVLKLIKHYKAEIIMSIIIIMFVATLIIIKKYESKKIDKKDNTKNKSKTNKKNDIKKKNKTSKKDEVKKKNKKDNKDKTEKKSKSDKKEKTEKKNNINKNKKIEKKEKEEEIEIL